MIYRPVLVTEAEDLPITVAEAMQQCRIDADALDATAEAEVTALLEAYIKASIETIEGLDSMLGRVISRSTWQQDFDCFARALKLTLGPVSSIVSVSYRDKDGNVTAVDSANYALLTDASGESWCRFKNAYALPVSLDEAGAVSVTYLAGYDPVPERVKQAIRLIVGAWYDNREETVIGVSVSALPPSVNVRWLLSPLQRMVI
ncbi:head-tail connector protein [Martelella soudanensis]|uniref:head-tail connector protein n=1 Tax=unclassified Martelella TaxID=2629616 RepID=UPI0015DEA05B|nr:MULTISPECIES: head-tail connector protein [unclassified Martelella]